MQTFRVNYARVIQRRLSERVNYSRGEISPGLVLTLRVVLGEKKKHDIPSALHYGRNRYSV